MCPPHAILNPLQKWLDTAICVKYFAIKRNRADEDATLLCLDCYVHEDLFEESEGTIYQGVTRHYLHIGNNRDLEICAECRDTLYNINTLENCEACTLEFNHYNVGFNPEVHSLEQLTVSVEIERVTISEETLNFPNFV